MLRRQGQHCGGGISIKMWFLGEEPEIPFYLEPSYAQLREYLARHCSFLRPVRRRAGLGRKAVAPTRPL